MKFDWTIFKRYKQLDDGGFSLTFYTPELDHSYASEFSKMFRGMVNLEFNPTDPFPGYENEHIKTEINKDKPHVALRKKIYSWYMTLKEKEVLEPDKSFDSFYREKMRALISKIEERRDEALDKNS